MIRAGTTSITFRKLSVRRVIELAAEARLEGIEWGGDVHVPHGDLAAAKEARRATVEAGLAVSSYGSYYRLAQSETNRLAFSAVLDSACELGASTVRVWAGTIGSAAASEQYRGSVVAEASRIADQAESRGVRVALELHANTLTDTTDSALNLLRAIGHRNVTTYWQPGYDADEEQSLDSIRRLRPHVSNVHVFHWRPHPQRRPLEEGADVWAKYLHELEDGQNRWALLEFVKDESEQGFLQDAATLRRLLT